MIFRKLFITSDLSLFSNIVRHYFWVWLNLPRKSLTDGDSPRFTIRLNYEIQTILADIDKHERSAFIREAILHYASSYTYRRKTSSEAHTNNNFLTEIKEKEQPSPPVRILHKPAWQR